MEPSFGVGGLIHHGELYDGLNRFDHDLPFYRKWCARAGGWILELCAGTGRLTLPLAEEGFQIVGLDCNESMLKRARYKATQQGLSTPFIQRDMRDFALDRRFELIFIPFNSFQCIYTREDQERVFHCIKSHLEEKGRFILEVFNPSIEMMVHRHLKEVEVGRFEKDDGMSVVIRERCRYDAASQVNRIEWKFEIEGEVLTDRLDMRCLYPQELDALLIYNGFHIVHKFGDHDESAFESQSPRQILICEVMDGQDEPAVPATSTSFAGS